MPTIEYFTQPFQGVRVRDVIRERVLHPAAIDGSEVTLVGAFATASGIALLRDAGISEVRENGGHVQIILGANGDEVTTREALAEAAEISDDLYIVKMRNRIFHPKIYCARFGDCGVVIDGSANPTENGLLRNVERIVVISYDLTDAQDLEIFERQTQQLIQLTDPEAFIEPEVPLGQGGPDEIGLTGAVWQLKLNGEIDEIRFRHAVRAFTSAGQATAARTRNRSRLRLGRANQQNWGLSVPRTVYDRGEPTETDLLDFLHEDGEEIPDEIREEVEDEQPENIAPRGEDDREIENDGDPIQNQTLTEIITLFLAEGVQQTRNQRLRMIRSIIGLTEIRGCNNRTQNRDYSTPTDGCIGGFKRIARNDLTANSRASEVFLGNNSIRRLLSNVNPVPNQPSYGDVNYLLLMTPNAAGLNMVPARLFHTGSVREGEIRLRTRFTDRFWEEVAVGDFLCVIPLSEMQIRTQLVQELENVGITPNLEDYPDALCFVISAANLPEEHQRFTASLTGNQVSGYMDLI